MGMRKVFEGWAPDRGGTLFSLESHYEKLSKRFGYPIQVPEETMNQIGYQFLRGGKTLEAIGVFKKNVKNYPDSSNVSDSLGDAYEKSGSKKQARENYQKAYELAIKKGETRQAAVYQKNVDRVSN